MRKIFIILVSVLLTATVWAQAPQKMSYQAVIRDASGVLITNQGIGMQITILKSTIPVYIEKQSATTNANGLVSFEIGGGAAVFGSFAAIDWSDGVYSIKTETDPTSAGGTAYTINGITQLLSVPYALFSANGTAGPAGPAGATGATGTAGANGIDGATGVTGATGMAGVNGVTGATGMAGANGTNGATGATGAYGGAPGATGPTGAAGLNGVTGATGATGTNGMWGATGATGATGSQGNTGGTGLHGVAGADGVDGAAGPAGVTGATGANGMWGNTGATGATGVTGAPGVDAGVGGFTHYLGEAYLGGIIYYIYKGSDGLEHGLIVSLTESTSTWQTTTTLVNANRTEDGAYNTALMTSSPAATYVATLGAGWYVPSIDELALLFNNRYSAQKGLRAGGNTLLSDAYYWSSYEKTSSDVYTLYFRDGSINYANKLNPYNIRGIKAF